MEPTETTLTDRYGNDHAYTIIPIPPSKSIDIAAELLATIARPGARLVRLGVEAGEITGDEEAAELFAKVDLTEVGADAEAALKSIAQNPDIVRRLFTNVFRDEEDLSNTANFDGAFAGNWTEMYAALKEIVDVNGFLAFLG